MATALATPRHPDLDKVEAMLPAHMMQLMAEQFPRDGNELRPDTIEAMNRDMAAILDTLDVFSVRRVATKVDTYARDLFTECAPQDFYEGFYVVCLFALKLAEELLINPQNAAVLTALVAIEELKEDNDGVRSARYKIPQMAPKAAKLMSAARALGLYPGMIQVGL